MTALPGTKRSIPTRHSESNSKENGEKVLRRSPRNLPAWLKEKVGEKPSVEQEPDISSLPPIDFKGKIEYVNNFHDCAMVCDDILQQIERSTDEIVPIGLDLEWPFSFQTGSGKTALAQICPNYQLCYLIHVYNLKTLPAAFVVLLCHPKVRLVGVNIKNDIWKLGRDFKEFPAQKVVENNCIDCGVFANRTLNRSCRWSMARLTAYLLKKKISKDREVRNSKWHIEPLSTKQKLYAATDAYVSLLLHLTIQKKAEEIALLEQSKKNQLTSNTVDQVVSEETKQTH